MRSTFNILFYVNKSKEKNGVVPVMGRVTINGTQSQFSCKKSIPLDMWDVKGNCAKGRSKEALQINRELDRSATKETLAWQEHQGADYQALSAPVRPRSFRNGRDGAQLLSRFWQRVRNVAKCF